MKGVILAGGRGQRCTPSTEVTNKHLLTIWGDRAFPMIWFPINTLVKSGCKEILIVSSQEHCGDIVETLGDGERFDGASFTYRVQDHNKKHPGIASALKLAEDFTKNDRFAVILGDNFYSDTFKDDFESFEKSDSLAQVFLKEVEDIQRFGCATLNDQKRVVKIVEKPKEPESNLAVTGLYLFTQHVYQVAKNLTPSDRGELEVTHINDYYAKTGLLSSSIIPNFWSDMGVPSSAFRTMEYINKAGFKLDFK